MPSIPRRSALALALLPLSACTLRLERNAAIPVGEPPVGEDAAGLEKVRRALQVAQASAASDTQRAALAHEAATLHGQQLRQLDAHLKALGATPSASTSPWAPAATSTAAPSPSVSPSISNPGAPPMSAWTTTAPVRTPSAWTAAESAWIGDDLLATIAKLSSHSRPTAAAIGAVGLSYAIRAQVPMLWNDDMTIPTASAPGIEARVAQAVSAMQWYAARSSDHDERARLGSLLGLLDDVRSLAQAVAPSANPYAGPQSFANAGAAKSAAEEAIQGVLIECASAAEKTSNAPEVAGILLSWSSANAALAEVGQPTTAFPGLRQG